MASSSPAWPGPFVTPGCHRRCSSTFVRDAHGRQMARVDFAYPELRLALDVHDWATHGSRAAFPADRERLNALAAAGWTRPPVHVARRRTQAHDRRRGRPPVPRAFRAHPSSPSAHRVDRVSALLLPEGHQLV